MSELRVTTISNAAGTGPANLTKQSAAKGFANINGTGTVALRSSFNVSSITDNGTGNYGVNWTSSMSNSDYATLLGMDVPSFWGIINTGTPSASTVALIIGNDTGTAINAFDNDRNSLAIHGDLA